MPLSPKNTTHTKLQPGKNILHTNISDIITPAHERKIPPAELALFCRKLAYMLESGLPMKTALASLHGKSLGTTLNIIVPKVQNKILNGESLSNALNQEGSFPTFMIEYIKIGEKAAKLPIVCEQLASYYEHNAKVKREVTAMLAYPAAIFIMMIAVIVFAMVMILPGYAQIFEASNIALPTATALLLDISAFLAAHGLVVLIMTIVLCLAVALFFCTHKCASFIALAKLRMPIYRLTVSLHLAQSLSLLLASGVRLSDAVLLCKDLTGNTRVGQDLYNVALQLTDGIAFSDAIATVYYVDALVIDMAVIGEKTGNMPQAMETCATNFILEYNHNITRIKKLIEPIITIVMGILIAFVMMAVILPTFELATGM